jgi:hypothetical protein
MPLITTPKRKLRELLADCPAVRSFLGVASSAAALQKIYSSWLYGDIAAKRPFIIVEHARLRLQANGAGIDNNFWIGDRRLAITLTCDDPLGLAVIDGEVTPADLESSTFTIESKLETIMEEMSDRLGVSDAFHATQLDLSINPTHNPPEDWAGEEGSYIWMQLMTSELGV